MSWSATRIAIVYVGLLSGCGSIGPRTVDNPDIAAKAPAIEVAVRNHDLSVVPQLVKDLDNDDPAVRFYASRGLAELTGETFGYRYYDSADVRRPAVFRWQQWLKQHEKE